jgi:hypothetical protein
VRILSVDLGSPEMYSCMMQVYVPQTYDKSEGHGKSGESINLEQWQMTDRVNGPG